MDLVDSPDCSWNPTHPIADLLESRLFPPGVLEDLVSLSNLCAFCHVCERETIRKDHQETKPVMDGRILPE